MQRKARKSMTPLFEAGTQFLVRNVVANFHSDLVICM